jgi:hypothetical protein
LSAAPPGSAAAPDLPPALASADATTAAPDTDDRGARLWPLANLAIAFNIIAVICGGLVLDATFGWNGQIAAIIWTFGVFAWLWRRGGPVERRVLILCTLIAGAGELVLSLVWGLYDYQFHNIPLFVPPGHALLMTLGLVVSARLPARGVALITAGAALWAVYAWWAGFDRFGVVLFGIYLVCVSTSRSRSARRLYATMFVLALAMELYGTALGNWAWRAEPPGIALSQANPPFSAGAFYCLLDLLVLAALRVFKTGLENNVLPDPK